MLIILVYYSELHDTISVKIAALEKGVRTKMTEDRSSKLNTALLHDLRLVHALQVDGSVLKNTGIAKTVKNINSTALPLVDQACTDLAVEIISRWKVQIKHDNKTSTIRNMKGGKLIEMPAGAEGITPPRCVPPLLWSKFCACYNNSQLFAIKYVSDQFEGGQDTRIALVQGGLICFAHVAYTRNGGI